MKNRWRQKYKITIGSATQTAPAARRVDPCVYCPWKNASPRGAVITCPEGDIIKGIKKSFQVHMKVRRINVIKGGTAKGTRIERKIRRFPAPSIRAASIIPGLKFRKNARIQKVPKASDCAICGKAIAQMVSVNPSERKS